MTAIKVGDRVMTPGLSFGYVIEINDPNIANVKIGVTNLHILSSNLVHIPELQFSNIRLGVDQIKCGAIVKDLNGRFHYITRLIDVPKAGLEVNTMVCTTNTAISFYSPDDLTYIG